MIDKDPRKFARSCPFCGESDLTSIEMRDHRATEYWLECSVCGARGPLAKSEDQALKGWDERSGDTP